MSRHSRRRGRPGRRRRTTSRGKRNLSTYTVSRGGIRL